MLMILFQMQRMDFFVPQLFAAAGNLHSFPVNSAVPSEVLIQYDAAFSFLSPRCHHKPLLRIYELGWHIFQAFQWINVSFKYLQIFFQISQNTLGKFEETTQTSVDMCLK